MRWVEFLRRAQVHQKQQKEEAEDESYSDTLA